MCVRDVCEVDLFMMRTRVCVCVCVCVHGGCVPEGSQWVCQVRGCVRYVALFSNSYWGGDPGYGNWSTYLGWE